MVGVATARVARPEIAWAIAGFGWVARDYVAPAIALLDRARLAGVCDPDPAARASAPRGVHAEPDLAALTASLGASGVVAVYVAAPNHLHRPIVEAAAAAGLHVLCEKPTATTLADAEAMVAACDAAGVGFATAYDQRFHAAHVALRERIASGDLGIVTSIRIHYACWVGADWAADNWRVDRARSGGGALVDLAPHALDLCAFLLGEEIVDVAALRQERVHAYAVDDGAVAIGRTASGVLVSLEVAYNCPETYPRRRLEIRGTRACIVAHDTMGQTPGGRLERIDAASGEQSILAYLDGARATSERSPFAAMIDAFSTELLAGRLPRNGAHDLHVMRLLEQMCR